MWAAWAGGPPVPGTQYLRAAGTKPKSEKKKVLVEVSTPESPQNAVWLECFVETRPHSKGL